MGKCVKSGVDSLVMDFQCMQTRGVGWVWWWKVRISLDFSTVPFYPSETVDCEFFYTFFVSLVSVFITGLNMQTHNHFGHGFPYSTHLYVAVGVNG